MTDEQCIHTPANMIIHCLRNNYIMLPIHYTMKTLLQLYNVTHSLYYEDFTTII